MSAFSSLRGRLAGPGGLAETLRLAWPLVLSMAAFAVMQFTDRVFLAHYSDTAIQASMPAGALSYLVVCFFQTAVGYSGTFVAQFFGARRRVACARSATQGIYLSLLSAPVMLATILPGFALLAAFAKDAAVLADERAYFGWLVAFGFAAPLNAALVGWFTGRGRTRLVMAATIIAAAANVLFDWWLIFGTCGFPRLGIAGAAIATNAAALLSALILAAVMAFDPAYGGSARRRILLVPDVPLAGRILRFGVPAGVHVVLDLATFTVFVFMTSILDPLSLTVSNICFAINNFAFSPIFGIGQAASILVGQYQGAKDSVAAARAGWCAQLVAVGWVVLFVLVLAFFNRPLLLFFHGAASAFTADEVLAVGRPLLLVLASWELFDSMNIVLGGALKGAGDTRFVMCVIAATGFGLWIPSAAAVLAWHPSIVALWLTYPLDALVIASIFAHRWFHGAWQSITLVQSQDE